MMRDTFEVYRCRECGETSISLGWLHAHIEKHRGYTRLGIQLPFGKTAPGNYDALMERTEILEVTEYRVRHSPKTNDEGST